MIRFFILILLFCCSSCVFVAMLPPRWTSSLNGEQPIKKEYHLSHKKPIFTGNLLDTNAIYITENDWVYSDWLGKPIPAEKATAFGYIRFGSNGVLYYSHKFIYHQLTDEDYNTFTQGQYCLYKVQNEFIMIESYNHNHHFFEYEYGVIQDNGDICFYKNAGRPCGTYTNHTQNIYRKNAANFKVPVVFPQ